MGRTSTPLRRSSIDAFASGTGSWLGEALARRSRFGAGISLPCLALVGVTFAACTSGRFVCNASGFDCERVPCQASRRNRLRALISGLTCADYGCAAFEPRFLGCVLWYDMEQAFRRVPCLFKMSICCLPYHPKSLHGTCSVGCISICVKPPRSRQPFAFIATLHPTTPPVPLRRRHSTPLSKGCLRICERREPGTIAIPFSCRCNALFKRCNHRAEADDRGRRYLSFNSAGLGPTEASAPCQVSQSLQAPGVWSAGPRPLGAQPSRPTQVTATFGSRCRRLSVWTGWPRPIDGHRPPPRRLSSGTL